MKTKATGLRQASIIAAVMYKQPHNEDTAEHEDMADMAR
jgi:hypothetical protein